ncbi:hypothetical protein [Pseudomonas sp. SO81]|uniref:hypothetical protein n=1 Tax=Pseudomonas sp. SO81 TaxID=2983246 RepID=UPI0025A48D91|nr:hypothetical protein [Pseudomonas sp. SO81]WJN57551.1 hypothetical protein OH686_02310 [Pseudomonas sp. SO81]
MSKFEKPDPVSDAQLVAKEVKEWEQHLNEITGLMGFTFGLAALGTPAPQFWGLISLIFVFTFHFTSSRNKMTKLRQIEKKKEKTDYDIWVAREIRKTIKASRTPVFLIGFTCLVIIALAPDLFMENEWILNKLYGDAPYSSASSALKAIFNYLFT